MTWRWLALSVLGLASPLFAAASSPFDGIPGIRFQYYAVAGGTPLEIYRSMGERGPDGGEALARTTWEMSVTWHEAKRGSVCRVDEPRAHMAITVLLPRLEESDELTPEGLAFWRATRKGLEIHEAGHARIAWEHRDDFNRAAAAAGCRSIQRVAKETQARIEAIQQAYDRDTNHGRNQTPKLVIRE
jgi:predicted secreted Zn-dependent protease